MSKILRNESYWVNYNGVTLKYTFKWFIPAKKLWLKVALFLLEHMELIYTYDAAIGSTGDVQQRVWSREKGVELGPSGKKGRDE